MLAGTNVEITQGVRVLGSVIGSSEASKSFLKDGEMKYTKVSTDFVNLLSPLPRMPMHV